MTYQSKKSFNSNHVLYNVKRRKKELKLLKMIETMQRNLRPIKGKPTLKIKGLSDEELMDLSLKVEVIITHSFYTITIITGFE